MSRDELDDQLIALLSKDARITNREVARRLEVSEGTVRNRLKRLERLNAARVVAVVRPDAVGLNWGASLRISATPAAMRSVAHALAARNEIPYVALRSGRFNVAATAIIPNRAELFAIVQMIKCLEGVISVAAFEVVRMKKYRVDVASIKNYHVADTE